MLVYVFGKMVLGVIKLVSNEIVFGLLFSVCVVIDWVIDMVNCYFDNGCV